MTTQYNINQYVKGINGFGLKFCDTIQSSKLSASSDTTLAVPATAAMGAPSSNQNNKFIAVISVDALCFVAVNASAAIPAGNTFASTTSELIPINTLYGKYVQTGDVLHFFSSGTPNVTVAFYAIQD